LQRCAPSERRAAFRALGGQRRGPKGLRRGRPGAGSSKSKIDGRDPARAALSFGRRRYQGISQVRKDLEGSFQAALDASCPMDPIEEKLVGFTDSFAFDNIEAPVLRAIKLRFIDTIGCALAGYNEAPAKIARSLARQVRGAVEAGVIGAEW